MNSIIDKIDGENVRIDDFIDCTYIYIYIQLQDAKTIDFIMWINVII